MSSAHYRDIRQRDTTQAMQLELGEMSAPDPFPTVEVGFPADCYPVDQPLNTMQEALVDTPHLTSKLHEYHTIEQRMDKVSHAFTKLFGRWHDNMVPIVGLYVEQGHQAYPLPSGDIVVTVPRAYEQIKHRNIETVDALSRAHLRGFGVIHQKDGVALVDTYDVHEDSVPASYGRPVLFVPESDFRDFDDPVDEPCQDDLDEMPIDDLVLDIMGGAK